MADFAAIRFQPSRPLLRELSADRLNSILAEIRRNKPLSGRGVTVRQTGQGTAIDLAASVSRGGTSTPATPQPWDLIARVDPENENQYLVSARPGTLNSILPSNWDEEFECNNTALHYAKAIIATDGTSITGVNIQINAIAPAVQEPQLFGIETTVEYLFGLFAEGQVYRVIGPGHIVLELKPGPIANPDNPRAFGELPYDIYYQLT